jgi:hypothetical protein
MIAASLPLDVYVRKMDLQGLQFPDHTFGTVFATLFCSVPDPVCKMAVDPTEAPASFTQRD